jgi:hypothetical protein
MADNPLDDAFNAAQARDLAAMLKIQRRRGERAAKHAVKAAHARDDARWGKTKPAIGRPFQPDLEGRDLLLAMEVFLQGGHDTKRSLKRAISKVAKDNKLSLRTVYAAVARFDFCANKSALRE